MAKQEFAKTIITQLEQAISKNGNNFNSSTPDKANNAIAQACTTYLISNTKIKVQYVGVMPNGNPDKTSDNMLISGTINPPKGTDFNTWWNSLCNNIVTGLKVTAGPGLVTATPPCIIWTGLANKPILSNLTGNDIQQKTWEAICNEIINWLTEMTNNIKTFPAKHETSAGISTIKSINIS